MRPPQKPTCAAILIAVLLPGHGTAQAATGLDGAALSWPWALPFFGILLSIAAGRLLFPKLWHRHYPEISAGWAALLLLALALGQGPSIAGAAFVHAMLAEYLSFIVVLFALHVVAGGILVTGTLHGTPLANTGLPVSPSGRGATRAQRGTPGSLLVA